MTPVYMEAFMTKSPKFGTTHTPLRYRILHHDDTPSSSSSQVRIHHLVT